MYDVEQLRKHIARHPEYPESLHALGVAIDNMYAERKARDLLEWQQRFQKDGARVGYTTPEHCGVTRTHRFHVWPTKNDPKHICPGVSVE